MAKCSIRSDCLEPVQAVKWKETAIPTGCGSPELWILLRILFSYKLLMHADSYCVVKTVG